MKIKEYLEIEEAAKFLDEGKNLSTNLGFVDFRDYIGLFAFQKIRIISTFVYNLCLSK